MATLPVADKKDIKIGLVSAVLGLVLIILLLLFLSFEVADPKPEPLRVEATSEIEEILLENLKVDMGGGSSGAPSDDPVSEPTPQTEKIIASNKPSNTKTNTGQSNKTNAPKSTGEPTTTKKDDNPFNQGGSGPKGPSTGPVPGKDIGPDANNGPSKIGDGSGRTRLNDPRVSDIQSDQNHTINLLAKINAAGNIISVDNIASKTTCTDQRILNKVMAAVQSQVKYSSKAGAGTELVYITVNLVAN